MTVTASAARLQAKVMDPSFQTLISLGVESIFGPGALSLPKTGCNWVSLLSGVHLAFAAYANNFLKGTAFKEIKSDRLYPSVGMKKPGEHLRVNFGQSPFVYDIDGLVQVRYLL
jgi:hypothetical protein